MRPASPYTPEPERGWELPCSRTDCAGRADWHIRWTSDGEISVLCTVHMDEAAGWYRFASHHQLSLGCRRPEREWGERACVAPSRDTGEAPVVEPPWLGEDLEAVYAPGRGDVAEEPAVTGRSECVRGPEAEDVFVPASPNRQ